MKTFSIFFISLLLSIHAVSADRLLANQVLYPGQQLHSKNNAYHLVMQSDGNAVVYNNKNQAIWSSQTYGSGAQTLNMQADGDLVLYTAFSKPKWASNTGGTQGAYLYMQDDGNLVIYDSANQPVWNSKGYPIASKPKPSPLASAMIDAVNQVRSKGYTCRGQYFPPAQAVALQPQLVNASSKHTDDLAFVVKTLSHTGSDGSSPQDRAKREGYTKFVYENAAGGYAYGMDNPAKRVDFILDLWLNSTDGHCENIMNPKHTVAGVARTIHENHVYWVILFSH